MSRSVYQVRVAGARGPGLTEADTAAFEALVADAEAAQASAEAAAADAAVTAGSIAGTTVAYGINPPVSGGSTAPGAGNASLISKSSAGQDGWLTELQIYCAAAAPSVTLFVCSVSGLTATRLYETVVDLDAGLNVIDDWNPPIESGQHVGVFTASQTNWLSYVLGGGTGFWFATTGLIGTGGTAVTSSTGNLEIGFSVSSGLLGESMRAQATEATLSAAVEPVGTITAEGIQPPAAGTGGVAGLYTRYAPLAIGEDGVVSSVSFWPGVTGSVQLVVVSIAGGEATLQAISEAVDCTADVLCEVSDFNPRVEAGWRLGIVSSTGNPDYKAISGYSLLYNAGMVGGGIVGASSTLAATVPTVQLQMGWSIASGMQGDVLELGSTVASLSQETFDRPAPVALDPGDVPAATDWLMLLTVGQSLGTGHNSLPVLSGASPFGHLTFGSGPRSSKPGSVGSNSTPGTTAAVPLFENTSSADGDTLDGETCASGACNGFTIRAALLDGIAPGTHVFFAGNAGHQGVGMAVISPGDPSNWYQLAIDQMNAVHGLGVTAGKTTSLLGVEFTEGAATADLAHSVATNRGLMDTLRVSLEADAQSIFGQATPVPMFMFQMSSHVLAPTYSGSIQQAVYEQCRDDPYCDFIAPSFVFPYASDQIHWSNLAQLWRGNYLARAMYERVIEQIKPRALWPVSATIYGGHLYVRFIVPTPPIEFVGSTHQRGLVLTDDSGDLALTNLRVEGGDTVVGTLARDTDGDVTLSVGLTHCDPSVLMTSGATHDIRDSTPDFFVHAGVRYPMRYVAPAFSWPDVVVIADQ